MLSQRMYIVNSPELVLAVQRQTKSLSFQPFVASMLPKLLLVDADAMEILKRNMDGDEGDWGLAMDTHRGIWLALTPGPQLDLMLQSVLTTLLPLFLEFAGSREARTMTELYAWVRRGLTLVGTESLYGPENPFRYEPGLEEAFWYVHFSSCPSYHIGRVCTAGSVVGAEIDLGLLRRMQRSCSLVSRLGGLLAKPTTPAD